MSRCGIPVLTPVTRAAMASPNGQFDDQKMEDGDPAPSDFGWPADNKAGPGMPSFPSPLTTRQLPSLLAELLLSQAATAAKSTPRRPRHGSTAHRSCQIPHGLRHYGFRPSTESGRRKAASHLPCSSHRYHARPAVSEDIFSAVKISSRLPLLTVRLAVGEPKGLPAVRRYLGFQCPRPTSPTPREP